jgi:hypothetical protein
VVLRDLTVSRTRWEVGQGWGAKRCCSSHGQLDSSVPSRDVMGHQHIGLGLILSNSPIFQRIPHPSFIKNIFFWQYLGLNSGLHACKTGTLSLEPCLQPSKTQLKKFY